MLQKFKITSYAFTVFCAVFMTLPVNTSAQLEVSEEGWEALSAGDLETADSDLLSLIMGMSETIEKMSETITELESKLAAIEDDLEKQKEERPEEGRSGLSSSNEEIEAAISDISEALGKFMAVHEMAGSHPFLGQHSREHSHNAGGCVQNAAQECSGEGGGAGGTVYLDGIVP